MSHPAGPAPGGVDPNPVWPRSLARVAAVRFARRSSHFEATVRFYRDLVRFPVHETFEDSYSSDGVIFGLPDATLTFEIVRSEQPVQVDPHDQLCLYLPGPAAMEAARRGLVEAGIEPVASHPYWAANGAATYRDPDGRELIFAPFIYGADEPVAPDLDVTIGASSRTNGDGRVSVARPVPLGGQPAGRQLGDRHAKPSASQPDRQPG